MWSLHGIKIKVMEFVTDWFIIVDEHILPFEVLLGFSRLFEKTLPQTFEKNFDMERMTNTITHIIDKKLSKVPYGSYSYAINPRHCCTSFYRKQFFYQCRSFIFIIERSCFVMTLLIRLNSCIRGKVFLP